MANDLESRLSRRERQVMDLLFARGEATVQEVAEALPDAPTDTAVRTFLRILEEKGHVKRRKEGRRHVYRPAVSRRRAARSALRRVLRTFFNNSMEDALAAHLANRSKELSDEELDRLSAMIEEARRKRT